MPQGERPVEERHPARERVEYGADLGEVAERGEEVGVGLARVDHDGESELLCEGELGLEDPALDVAGRHPSKTSEGTASDLAPLWREIAGAVAAVIDRTTFGDLAEQVKARQSPDRTIYHI